MWLLAVIAGLALFTLGGVSLVVWQSLHPARFTLRETPKDDGVAYEGVTFPSRDGFPLVGWWVPCAKPTGTIILCHGYPSDRRDVLPMIPFLHRAGYDVLAFDFRRLGESSGDMSTIGLREPRDLIGAVDYAAKRSKKPIFALGESMGAATCIMAAAQDDRIKGVIADSPYTSLDIQTVRRFGGGPIGRVLGGYAAWLGERIVKQRLSDASPLASSRLLTSRPMLLIHSVNDRIIPVQDSKDIFAVIHGPKELWVTQASGHVRSYGEFKAEYQRRVLSFLHAIVHHHPVH